MPSFGMFCVVLVTLSVFLCSSQAFLWHLWNRWTSLDCGLFRVHEVCNYPKLMVLNRLVCLVSPLHKYLSRWVYTNRSSVSTWAIWISCSTLISDAFRAAPRCYPLNLMMANTLVWFVLRLCMYLLRCVYLCLSLMFCESLWTLRFHA